MSMEVRVKRGPVIHTVKGKALYVEWPDGSFTKDGKRITKEEAKRLRES